jgi:hypothetical protein
MLASDGMPGVWAPTAPHPLQGHSSDAWACAAPGPRAWSLTGTPADGLRKLAPLASGSDSQQAFFPRTDPVSNLLSYASSPPGVAPCTAPNQRNSPLPGLQRQGSPSLGLSCLLQPRTARLALATPPLSSEDIRTGRSPRVLLSTANITKHVHMHSAFPYVHYTTT